MKKIILILLITFFTFNSFNLISQQVLGKWVIPSTEIYPYEITFTDDGLIDELQLTQQPPLNSLGYHSMSGGGYSDDYDRYFYMVNNQICTDASMQSYIEFTKLQPEFQIINIPGQTEKYFSFFIPEEVNTSRLHFNEIHYSSSGVTTHFTNYFIGGWAHGFAGFAISEEINGIRNLFTVGPNTEMDPYQDAALHKWSISSSGVTWVEEIVDKNYQSLTESHFDAYNVEYTEYFDGNEDIDVIAWIHGTFATNPEEIIVVIDETPYIYDLGLGRIGGIEFSTIGDNMLYASTTNGGIVKIDYTTFNTTPTIISVPGAPVDNYGRTYLQTAPDGHIYGVSNDGTMLGRIYQYDFYNGQTEWTAGEFESDIPIFDYPLTSISSFRNFGDPGNTQKYYILPENQRRVHNLITPTVETTPTCPNVDEGTATITIEGDFPPYKLVLFKDGNTTPYRPLITISGNMHTYYDLPLGIYKCTITDDNDNTTSKYFTIKLPPFDVPDIIEQIDEFEPLYWTDIDSRTYEYGIHISGNTSITVTNSKLEFGPDAKIIIEPGSELILNKSTLTNYEDCYDPWQGIEVWGNSNHSQYIGADGIMYQGKLTVKNESFIKNSLNAVTTQNPLNFNSHGGIIIAENSTFENNKRSIEIMAYNNFNPYATDIQLPYVSRFKDCSFTIDDNYLMSDFNTHVSLWNIYGLIIYGCDFLNNNTSLQHEGQGIYSLNAGYALLNLVDGPNIIQNEFHNLYTGIHAGNTKSSTNRPYVNNAKFINNSTGVFLSLVENAILINNLFEIAPNYRNESNCGDHVSGFGIDAFSSSGFIFENNKFQKFDTGIPDKFYTGIHVKNCPSPHDIIYKNEYTGLSFGNYAEGMNRDRRQYDVDGIEYQCNENTGNGLDFIVAAYDPIDARIRTFQGLKDNASGNTFSQSPEIDGHFINLGTQAIDYYYYPIDPIQIPTLYSIPLVVPDDAPINFCPDHYGSGGSIKLSSMGRLEEELNYANNLSDYNSVSSLYESLLDGGNTTSKLLDIETATPDDMWALRSQLLGDSPYLSKEVLMTMSDRTDVLPDDAIFEILAANPEELKKDTLISFLEKKEDPLPDYMISILKQLAITNTTYKTVLLNDMAKYNGNKIQAAKSIIHSILSDSIIDKSDLRGWLSNMQSIESDKQIISSYIVNNDTSNALALLNMMPSLYELEGEELNEFIDYKDLLLIQMGWNNIGKTIFELDSFEIALLEFYADSTSGDASVSAKNILSFAFGYDYCNCLSYTDTLYYKSENYFMDELNSNCAINISASPNPASSWVAFDYTLAIGKSVSYIKVTNIIGNVVAEFEITDKQGQQLWDTRSISPGVYIYTLFSNGYKSSDKVIIK